MAADNSVLLDRTRHRKIDYETNKIYHIPAKDSKPLCPTIEPLGKDGKVDAAVMARWAAPGGGARKMGAGWSYGFVVQGKRGGRYGRGWRGGQGAVNTLIKGMQRQLVRPRPLPLQAAPAP